MRQSAPGASPRPGAFLARVRKYTDLPLGVGFGISRPEHVESVGKLAEAIFVGTAIIAAVDRRSEGQSPAEVVAAFIREMLGR